MTAMIKLRLALSLVGVILALCRHFSAAYTPADNYLIACGSDVDTPVGRRVFVADTSGSVTLTTTSRSAAVKAPPDSVVPARFDKVGGGAATAVYLTARVFTAPSSYSFKISRPGGHHFVRLHFFPFASGGYDLAAASFKVSTQDAVLLDGFTPAAAGNNNNNASCQEFLLRVDRDVLTVTFVPLLSGGSRLAFVNAIEVVSVLDNLYAGRAVTFVPAWGRRRVNKPAELPLQTAYRVNVGGPAVAADGDALWREWTTDRQFLIGTAGTRQVVYNRSLNRLAGDEDDAPDVVYATARQLDRSNWLDTSKQMTWQFDVGVGDEQQPSSSSSCYLVRLHLCDIVSSAPHLLLIDVYLNGRTAVTDLDLFTVGSGTLASPYAMDFVLDSSDDPAGKISITVGSSSTMKENGTLSDPILNGIEIVKVLVSSGSVSVVGPATGSTKRRLAIVVGSVCGAFAAVSVAVLVLVIIRRKKEDKVLPTSSSSQSSPPSTPWMPLLGRFSFRSGRPSASGTGSSPSFTNPGSMPRASPMTAWSASSVPSYRVPFAVLQEATNDFDESLVVGAGGFGTVYRGALPDGTAVAVKRASPASRQGAREFRAEVELLSSLRHRHLVSLFGYCDDGDEMILVYEYMENGTLRSRLSALGWPQRLEACVGAATGLIYLHTAATRPVIHRDVKSSNILLDGGLVAKVADFGLSRDLDNGETHVSTAVKGSFGYVDPEYARTRRLTPKSDVYSFGVVLLEALCGRPAVDPRLPSLVEWGLHWQRRGELEKVVDRRVAAAVKPAALRKYGETVARCLAERAADRPAMEDVVWSLKLVARLQEDDGDGLQFSDVDSFMLNGLTPPSSDPRQPRSSPESETRAEEEDDVEDGSYTDVSMGAIFRQMINVRGR